MSNDACMPKMTSSFIDSYTCVGISRSAILNRGQFARTAESTAILRSSYASWLRATVISATHKKGSTRPKHFWGFHTVSLVFALRGKAGQQSSKAWIGFGIAVSLSRSRLMPYDPIALSCHGVLDIVALTHYHRK